MTFRIHQGSSIGASTLPQSNMISFANSFAHFPSLPSQAFRSPTTADLGSVNLEASSLNMCVDALYIHELHHMEVIKSCNLKQMNGLNWIAGRGILTWGCLFQLRRRGPRASAAGHHSHYPLGNSSFHVLSTQPQVHSVVPPQTTSRFETEKTPLLHGGGHFNPFS